MSSGRSADKATPEDVHRYQLWLTSIGTTGDCPKRHHTQRGRRFPGRQ
jgi:hypothetical protein